MTPPMNAPMDAKKKKGFWIYEWKDETSRFDLKGEWQAGTECYMRTYRIYVPVSIKPGSVALEEYVDREINNSQSKAWL